MRSQRSPLSNDREEMSKTLSNGTLGLRFMQNALRAKQLKEVQLQRAEVVDEGKWEVSQAVREALGLHHEEQEVDLHEASYLPFLFSDTPQGKSEEMPRPVHGRRIFNKSGEDVFHTNDKTAKDGLAGPSASASLPPPESSSTTIKGRIHAHPHPISISTLNTSRGALLKGFDQLSGSDRNDYGRSHKPKNFREKGKQKEKEIVSARQTIFESGNVGVDLRARATVTARREVYMKPAGVDEPGNMAASGSFRRGTKSEDESAEGSRPSKTEKSKRERDGDEDDERKKSKRKRKRKTPESINE